MLINCVARRLCRKHASGPTLLRHSIQQLRRDITTPTIAVKPPQPSPKLLIHHVLTKLRKTSVYTLKRSATVQQALVHITTKHIPAALVVDDANSIVGLYTSSDILRYMGKFTPNNLEVLSHTIDKVMTMKDRLIYCSPSDSVTRCREIMFQLKIRNMVIIDKGTVLGVANIRDLSDVSFNITDSGNKIEIFNNLVGRKGIPKDWSLKPCANIPLHLQKHGYTSGGGVAALPDELGDYEDEEGEDGDEHDRRAGLAEPLTRVHQQEFVRKPRKKNRVAPPPPLHVTLGACILPHPFKRPGAVTGVVAPNRRHYGPGKDLAVDLELCEDAYFMSTFPSATFASSADRTSAAVTTVDESAEAANAAATALAAKATLRNNSSTLRHVQPEDDDLIYMCVSDGVGGWREHGVDPRVYAYSLVGHAKQVLRNHNNSIKARLLAREDLQQRLAQEAKAKAAAAAALAEGATEAPTGGEDTAVQLDTAPLTMPHPLNVIREAWEKTNHIGQSEQAGGAGTGTGAGGGGNGGVHMNIRSSAAFAASTAASGPVVGSATICVAAIDLHACQLTYSNIGDSGLLILRHVDNDIASLSSRQSRAALDWDNSASSGSDASGDDNTEVPTKPLQIAYISQQQLKQFNLPYQLGFSNLPQHQQRDEDGMSEITSSFENPNDADTASVPIYPNDIVLLATDGLFDNVFLPEIVAIVSEWEEEHFGPNAAANSGNSSDRDPQQLLAEKLTNKAREYSIDTRRDSPFALLAKDNDILWNLGGKPDDTVVVVARITANTNRKRTKLDGGGEGSKAL